MKIYPISLVLLVISCACGVDKLAEKNEPGTTTLAPTLQSNKEGESIPTNQPTLPETATERESTTPENAIWPPPVQEGTTKEETEEPTVYPVTIENLKNITGQMCLSVFNKSEGFPTSASKAWFSGCYSFESWDGTINIKDLKAGVDYAIAVFHDENSNKDLDTRPIFGDLKLPIEGFGFSNNPGLRIGPPTFSDAAFKTEKFPNGIVIKLLYPI